MTLDLAQVSRQIEAMGQPLVAAGQARLRMVERALAALASLGGQADALRAKVAARQGDVLFPLAGLTDDPARCLPPPPCPADYAAMAVDGSQIAPDRHFPLACYLINIGSASLRYGAAPDAWLASQPQLCFQEEDLYIVSPGDPDRRERIDGALLNARRDVEECAELARLAAGREAAVPALAMLDNSLILWGLLGRRFEDYVKDHLLGAYFRHSESIRAAATAGPLALAGYISRPGADSVVNTLRLGLCQQADCQVCRRHTPPGRRDCDGFAGLTDRELFAALLPVPGQRSAIFVNLLNFAAGHFAGVVERYYRDREVRFFYLNTGEEIARVELPQWVAEDGALLDVAHALVYDQVRRGDGYPVALAEAHEQAVVGAQEREQFWYLVETMASEHGLSFASSAKAFSKRVPGV